jgi:hypothetical protein
MLCDLAYATDCVNFLTTELSYYDLNECDNGVFNLGVHYGVAQNTSMFILKDIFVMAWKNVYGIFPH